MTLMKVYKIRLREHQTMDYLVDVGVLIHGQTM